MARLIETFRKEPLPYHAFISPYGRPLCELAANGFSPNINSYDPLLIRAYRTYRRHPGVIKNCYSCLINLSKIPVFWHELSD